MIQINKVSSKEFVSSYKKDTCLWVVVLGEIQLTLAVLTSWLLQIQPLQLTVISPTEDKAKLQTQDPLKDKPISYVGTVIKLYCLSSCLYED